MAFPTNPQVNDVYTESSTTFIWDGEKWLTTASGGANFAIGPQGATGPIGATGAVENDANLTSLSVSGLSAVSGVRINDSVIGYDGKVLPEDNIWRAVTYGDGKFVAVAPTGTNRAMSSTDGITWSNSYPVPELNAEVYLTAPDGGRWKLTVDNSGNLTTTSA